MVCGYAGKILYVDLGAGSIRESDIAEETYRGFVGGYGLGIRILYERMKPGADPLGPDNILGFVTGALTATPVPGSGRYGVVTKSPLTGAWCESNGGGTFGPELKTSGYDAVFFSGVSPKPVYLLIREGRAELRDASAIWGRETYETEDVLGAETGDPKLVTATIGPSGEARSLLAGILNERGRLAARGGAGAVMGSKRLKAVALRGGARKIEIARREGLRAARDKYMKVLQSSEFAKGLSAAGTGGALSMLVSIGDSPVRNWSRTGAESMPSATRLDSGNMDKYKQNSYGCRACPIRCGAIIRQQEGPFAIPGEMHRPEYETLAALGSLLENDNLESVIAANDICNRYAIDTISTGTAIAYAMECYANGLITLQDTGGIDLSWGNAEAVVALTRQIARREGFGAVLADGPARAAERIGKGREYVMAVRGKGIPFHDPRMSAAAGTALISDANPGHHMNSQITAMLENGVPIGSDPALAAGPGSKGDLYRTGAAYHALFDNAGMCGLYLVNTPPPDLAELISQVTGWDFTWEEALRAGRRILTLRQAFNCREGVTPDMVSLPDRIGTEPLPVGPGAPPKIDFYSLREDYFAAMGWDRKTGVPLARTLEELGLQDLVKGAGRQP